MNLKAWMDSHKKAVYGGLGVVGLVGGYALIKKRSSSSTTAQPSTQYLTPDQLLSSPSGGLLTLGGSSAGETIGLPGNIGGAGASQTSGATLTTPAPTAASLLGFTNPQTPVRLVGGSLIDTGTGRVAYYGPNGQPGSASQFAGSTSYVDPSGKTVFYNANGYNYADTTRAPDLPPLAA